LRAQATLDAVFALFIAIGSIAIVSQVLSQNYGHGALEIERKATDVVLVLLEQDTRGLAEGNASAVGSAKAAMLEVKSAHGLSGIRVSAGKGSVLVGESSGFYAKKHFVAHSENGFVVGEAIVWE